MANLLLLSPKDNCRWSLVRNQSRWSSRAFLLLPQLSSTTPIGDSPLSGRRSSFRKLEGKEPPWTDDPIIARHKFTNAYRASDRVSQYLIRNVIYHGDQSVSEVFFRTILFKLFNKIETWELLRSQLGEITWEGYSFDRVDLVLSDALASKDSYLFRSLHHAIREQHIRLSTETPESPQAS